MNVFQKLFAEAKEKAEVEQAAKQFEASEDRRLDREERMERRRAIEAEDDAMARSTKISEARVKALANPKPRKLRIGEDPSTRSKTAGTKLPGGL